jgi:hypothetical protein
MYEAKVARSAMFGIEMRRKMLIGLSCGFLFAFVYSSAVLPRAMSFSSSPSFQGGPGQTEMAFCHF